MSSGAVPPGQSLQLLSDQHDLAAFDSGEPSLDAWLREHAIRTARRHLSATHVWAGEDGGVTAYVTLSAAIIRRLDLPKALGHGYPDTIPAVLLGRLALHKDLHGRKLGSLLLAQALTLAAASATSVAAAFVVVDALHGSAVKFYLHHGFTRLEGTERLVLKVATITAAQ